MVDLLKLRGIKEDFKLLFQEEKYSTSLPKIQEIIANLEAYLPPDDPELQDYLVDFVQNLNAAGMISLERSDYQTAYRCLKKAETIKIHNLEAQSTTYNNLGIYYKKRNKFTTALLYLQKSLQIQLKNDNSVTLPDIYVNLAAALSSLGNHHEATMNAMMAIILQQHNIMTILLARVNPEEEVINPERFNVLSLGYHNLAVQLEHIQKNDEARKCYERGYDIIKNYNYTNKKLSTFLQRSKETFLKSSKSSFEQMPRIGSKAQTKIKTESQSTEAKFKDIRLKFQNDIEKFKTNYNQRRNSHFNIMVRKHTRNLSKDLNVSKFSSKAAHSKSINLQDLLQRTSRD